MSDLAARLKDCANSERGTQALNLFCAEVITQLAPPFRDAFPKNPVIGQVVDALRRLGTNDPGANEKPLADNARTAMAAASRNTWDHNPAYLAAWAAYRAIRAFSRKNEDAGYVCLCANRAGMNDHLLHTVLDACRIEVGLAARVL